MVLCFLYLYTMKSFFSILLVLFCSLQISAQSKFQLHMPDSKKLLKQFEESQYKLNIVDTFLQKHYTDISGKTNILKDPDFNNIECGFTRKFKEGISYSYKSCGEATGVYETLIFPKTQTALVKKFVEALAKSLPNAEDNQWIKGKAIFSPKGGEAGCYYYLEQKKTTTVVRIECGC